jgi:acetylornithine deacetylase/succinyl-diaminopimelate desuccinylase-like protein
MNTVLIRGAAFLIRCTAISIVASAVLSARPAQAQAGAASLNDLMRDPLVRASRDAVRSGEPRTIEDQIRFCEIPAPPFKEAARGEALRQTFQQLGLRNVRVDKAGNVLGDRPGAAVRPRVILSAHLDTVFPEGVDVRVTRDGASLRGPGIGDDCRGLAVLIGTIRALRQTNLQTPGTLTFVATVGEEGLGDLRGVKQLFKETLAGEVDRFVSIDGAGLGVTNVGVGSLRYRVVFKGPGGHSFAAFGMANPIDAMGRAIAKIADFQVAAEPKTTFNVGRVGGGTSVNSIPAEAWMEVDMRSSVQAALAALDGRLQKAIDAAVLEENDRWRTPRMITVVKERVGERPAGSTPADSVVLRAVEAVHRTLGLPVALSESSTDSNIPMSLHIPAITIGGGGRGTGAHAVTESFDPTDSWRGTERALLLAIALAQK